PPPTRIHTLSLHDALPIYSRWIRRASHQPRRTRQSHRKPATHAALRSHLLPPKGQAKATEDGRVTSSSTKKARCCWTRRAGSARDRKSTRLNSSHVKISYA